MFRDRPCFSFCRGALFAGLVGLQICLGAAAAQANAIVDLIWSFNSGGGPIGTSVTTASPGDQLTLEVYLTTTGSSGYSISFTNDSELTVTNAFNTPDAAFAFPVGPTSIGGNNVDSLGAAATVPALAGNYLMGSIDFTVVGPVLNDGDDVFSGLFNAADGISDSSGNPDIQLTFNGAQVVPEPGTLALVGGGVLALAWRGRRRIVTD